MRRVGFVLKRGKPEAESIARALIPPLLAEGRSVVVQPDQAQLAPGVEVATDGEMGSRVDILLVLGGDGTLLNGASLAGDAGVPVLGINLGTLGFLVPFAPADAARALRRALAGELAIEERMRLRVRMVTGDVVTERSALNDAVISQGSVARLVDLQVTIDGEPVGRYKADGLIVSTPTGSTAYNLAAGGPILTPTQASLAVTPICAHTLTHRPLVVPASSRVGIELNSGPGVFLTVDGQWGFPLAIGDRVEIVQATTPLRLYRSEKPYFEILREKLSWGSRAS